jgi:hypothetical protein
MPMMRYKPEQIVTLLRQIEVAIANGKTTPQACKEAEAACLPAGGAVQRNATLRGALSDRRGRADASNH